MTAPATLVRSSFPDLLPQDRAPGLHLSAITRSLCLGLGDFDDDLDPPYNLMRLGLTMQWGLSFQLAHEHPGRYYRVWDQQHECWKFEMQVERDGIWGNIDLLNVDTGFNGGCWAVEDPKMTRKSSKHGHDDVSSTGGVQWAPKWREAWMRVAGYCWMVPGPARVGRLWVAHLFDYSARFGGDVVAGCWERRWDGVEGERELAENWEVILRHAAQMPRTETGYV